MGVELTPRGTRGSGLPKIARWGMKVMTGAFIAVWPRIGTRMRFRSGPLLLLTTTGAKTGRRRQTFIASLPDGDSWLIVGSNVGAAQHPGWFFNMAKHPDQVWVEIGGRKLRVRPESLKGAEREAAWGRFVALGPGYGAYAEKTDRVFPIVRLTPVE